MATLNKFIDYLEEQVRNHSIYVWGAQGQKAPTITASWIRSREDTARNANRAIAYWQKQVSAGYGNVLRAFDCSGLGMYFLYNMHKVLNSDLSAHNMYGKCTKITKTQLKRGDWVFRMSSGRCYHIGYVVDDGLNVIESKGRDDGVIKRGLNGNGASYWNAFGRPACFKKEIESSANTSRTTTNSSGGVPVSFMELASGVIGKAAQIDTSAGFQRGASPGTYELMIQNGDNIYYPAVVDGISLELERKGAPGKLTFAVIADDTLKITEGNAVRLKADGKNLFYGFIFQRKANKGDTVSITAYDQLRYLKNKDTYAYSNKTATEVINMVAGDFRLQCGTLADTKYKIASRVEDNQTLFDIIQTALDMTLQNAGKLYVMYDDFGKITLKDIESDEMQVNILIDAETGESFSYTSSIDGDTYNKIKLSYENEDTGKREIYIAQDGAHMNEWGVLQFFESIDKGENGKAKADALLKLYNVKSRKLDVKGCFGDVRVRAGSNVIVSLDLGDIKIHNYMLVEKVKHSFKESAHTMDLTLRGGLIYG